MSNISRKFFLFTLFTATIIAIFVFFLISKLEFVRSDEFLFLSAEKNIEKNVQKEIELPVIATQPPPKPVDLLSIVENQTASSSDITQIPTPIKISTKILIDAPFTAQAPYADWNDPRQDYGCEEAASLMAIRWAEGKKLTPEEALQEIIAISEFEKKKYGEFHDTSSQDTLDRIIKDYFGYTNAFLRYDITIKDIKKELADGNLVIVPVDGRKLKNSFYTEPGPERHKILITGYDDTAQEFITNDPGTYRGAGYRYGYAILEGALMDYVTGKNEPFEQIRSAMIVVSK
ncbi:MAG: C39 family peptidase [Patescibacteria group bacterium]